MTTLLFVNETDSIVLAKFSSKLNSNSVFCDLFTLIYKVCCGCSKTSRLAFTQPEHIPTSTTLALGPWSSC